MKKIYFVSAVSDSFIRRAEVEERVENAFCTNTSIKYKVHKLAVQVSFQRRKMSMMRQIDSKT